MSDELINLIFGLIAVLAVSCWNIASTARVANKLKEQADRIEAQLKRIELVSGPAQVRQNIVNRYTHARIDDLEQQTHEERAP